MLLSTSEHHLGYWREDHISEATFTGWVECCGEGHPSPAEAKAHEVDRDFNTKVLESRVVERVQVNETRLVA